MRAPDALAPPALPSVPTASPRATRRSSFPQPTAHHRRESRLEGHGDGQRDVLRRQLARRFGSLPEAITARIDAAGSDDIERGLDHVLDATSVADVFAAP